MPNPNCGRVFSLPPQAICPHSTQFDPNGVSNNFPDYFCVTISSAYFSHFPFMIIHIKSKTIILVLDAFDVSSKHTTAGAG
jgi:hypothetical protein